MTRPNTKYRKDYVSPAYTTEHIHLFFDLYDSHTLVKSVQTIQRCTTDPHQPCTFDGRPDELISVTLNQRLLAPNEYLLTEDTLTLLEAPERFTIEFINRLQPHKNTTMSGLYQSNGNFCTQCEAEGFRSITYFFDRPDVMARYQCRIEADAQRYPILLSNGNLLNQGTIEGGRHWVEWEDPFKKPSYLFALVAGDFSCLQDEFQTKSGRKISLQIYVEHRNADKCSFAMESLKQAMKWDEEVYGREYDLDLYVIVAVDDFNAGAMENKGLNVFNSKLVLAKPETASDADFQSIEAVVAHEYFHNWTGNRVTLRDWFQLSLKEGLTVFRDQSFSADRGSIAVKRIQQVKMLRAHQFPEDAGPMAHPIRPESYIEMNNFYTTTVYEKGAEVVRMIHLILGKDAFRRSMDLYFDRHDGQAVTTEDFVKAMEDGSGADLKQFRLWYSQAGTPIVHVSRHYNPTTQEYTLELTQQIPNTPEQTNKQPMHIPIALSLLDQSGKDMKLTLKDGSSTSLLHLKEKHQTFTFIGIKEEPVPSILRGFSSPIKIQMNLTVLEQIHLLAQDLDPFNRWDAAQQLLSQEIFRLIENLKTGLPLELDGRLVEAFRKTLQDPKLDEALIAQILSVPSEMELGDLMSPVDVEGIHLVRDLVMKSLATALHSELITCYKKYHTLDPYEFTGKAVAARSLKNLALTFLGKQGTSEARNDAFLQFQRATNMTDQLAALAVLSHQDCQERIEALDAFYHQWKEDPLVLDKWFSIQAASQLPGTLDHLWHLLKHPAFSLKNPNKVRSLIGTFCRMNPWHFHQINGAGYTFLADQVLALDALNPQVASRLVSAFNRWQHFDEVRKNLMNQQLQRILSSVRLSKDVYEIVSKALSSES